MLVIAPHQDDEVLACGGTIIKRIREGHSVSIVFLTDGRRGCGDGKYADPEDIKSIRHLEAINATRSLGVPVENIYFLDFHDGNLKEKGFEVKKKLLDLLSAIQPDEIFMPGHKDFHPDHSFTNKSVLSVVKVAKITADIYEYIIWDKDTEKRPDKTLLKYNAAENVRDVLDLKKRALFEYKCQTTIFFPTQKKPLMSNDFLGRYLKEIEHFVKYRIVKGKIKKLNWFVAFFANLMRRPDLK